MKSVKNHLAHWIPHVRGLLETEVVVISRQWWGCIFTDFTDYTDQTALRRGLS